MTVEELLPQLEAVRKSGRGWMVRCPAHDDRSPSLSVREGEKGILLHCFAGCNLASICASLGLKPKDLFYDTDGLVDRDAFRRVKAKRQAERLRQHTMGRRADALREADAVIRASTNLDISMWSDAQIDTALTCVCDAYALQLREDADEAERKLATV